MIVVEVEVAGEGDGEEEEGVDDGVAEGAGGIDGLVEGEGCDGLVCEEVEDIEATSLSLIDLFVEGVVVETSGFFTLSWAGVGGTEATRVGVCLD